MREEIVKSNEITPAYVKRMVRFIDKEKYDFEGAHYDEDQLYQDIMQAIYQGRCEDSAECCRLALKSQQIDFPRHRA